MAPLGKTLTALALGLVGLASPALSEQCGNAFYDPAVYVCYNNQFLCPIINGEGLLYCNGACYSRFMYQCTNSGTVLDQLPQLPSGTRFILTAWNPTVPAVHGKPIQACGQHWYIGGPTCSYCPEQVGSACPPGNTTSMVVPQDMNTMVPGGQRFYLDPYWSVAYTQAHSAYIPPGSTVGGLVAYANGGGFVNLNGPGTGWIACPSTASGGGGVDGRWDLRSENATTAPNRPALCKGINLAVNVASSDREAAWQYT